MPRDPLTDGRDVGATEPLEDSAERLLQCMDGLCLLVLHRDNVKVALLEPGAPLVVGRSPPAAVCVPDRKLSREHARFSLEGAEVRVEDLGSTNGTWLLDKRVENAMLSAGGEVLLGNETRARILGRRSDATPQPATPWSESSVAGGDGRVTGAAMRELMETVTRVTASPIPVVLHGETGVGKEVLARFIHENGPRREHRMVTVHCGAIPATLLETTLFGHEKGAFTGAALQQKGVFEAADKSTVFLDELGELSLAAQTALLRVLEVGRFCRVGSNHEIAVDVRVIAATHRDLTRMVQEGVFREDLYYRLDTMVLKIPPLRDRPDEIAPLANRFLLEASAANARVVRGIAPEALLALQAYRWPGNVRELNNAIRYAVAIGRSDMLLERDLPTKVRSQDVTPPHPTPVSLPPLLEARAQHEAQLIVSELQASDWNRTRAAQKLGIPVRTLSHRMKVLGIKKPSR